MSKAKEELLPAGAKIALATLIVINLINYIDRQVLAAVVIDIQREFFTPEALTLSGLREPLDKFQTTFGFTPQNAMMGLLSMAFMAVYMIGAPIFAQCAGKTSRWTLIGIGVILWSLASGASGLCAGFIALLFTRCFVGIGEAAYGPIAPAMISDYFPVKKRGQVLAWFYTAIPVGSALGYVIGEQVAKSGIGPWSASVFGFVPDSWRWAFYLLVPPGLLLGVWCFFQRDPREDPAARVEAEVQTSDWDSVSMLHKYLHIVKTPSYTLCTLGMTAMTFAIGGIAFWMPYYLEHRPGVSGSPTTVFGVITVVSGLTATLLGGMAGDWLRSRYSGSYFLVSGAAMLIGFPMMLVVIYAPFPSIWVFIFLTCFCLFFNTGPTNTILANVTPAPLRSLAFALNIFVIHAFGDVISPFLIGLISDKYSMDTAFIIVGLMFLVSAVFWLLGARYLKRDTELASGNA